MILGPFVLVYLVTKLNYLSKWVKRSQNVVNVQTAAKQDVLTNEQVNLNLYHDARELGSVGKS